MAQVELRPPETPARDCRPPETAAIF